MGGIIKDMVIMGDVGNLTNDENTGNRNTTGGVVKRTVIETKGDY